MANKKRGEISAKFQGDPITLKVTINGMCQFEERDGMGIFEAFSEMEDHNKMKIGRLRLIVWSMMLFSRPEATEEEAGLVMDEFPGGLTAAMKAIGEAIRVAFGTPKKGDAPGE